MIFAYLLLASALAAGPASVHGVPAPMPDVPRNNAKAYGADGQDAGVRAARARFAEIAVARDARAGADADAARSWTRDPEGLASVLYGRPNVYNNNNNNNNGKAFGARPVPAVGRFALGHVEHPNRADHAPTGHPVARDDRGRPTDGGSGAVVGGSGAVVGGSGAIVGGSGAVVGGAESPVAGHSGGPNGNDFGTPVDSHGNAITALVPYVAAVGPSNDHGTAAVNNAKTDDAPHLVEDQSGHARRGPGEFTDGAPGTVPAGFGAVPGGSGAVPAGSGAVVGDAESSIPGHYSRQNTPEATADASARVDSPAAGPLNPNAGDDRNRNVAFAGGNVDADKAGLVNNNGSSNNAIDRGTDAEPNGYGAQQIATDKVNKDVKTDGNTGFSFDGAIDSVVSLYVFVRSFF